MGTSTGNKILIIALIALVLFVLCSDCKAQWNTENGAFLKYDKIEHFTGCAGLYTGLRLFQSQETALYTTIGLQFLWEVKDELMPYQKYGWWGGEGFCNYDMAAGTFGALLAYGIDKLIHIKRVKVSYNETLNITYNF